MGARQNPLSVEDGLMRHGRRRDDGGPADVAGEIVACACRQDLGPQSVHQFVGTPSSPGSR